MKSYVRAGSFCTEPHLDKLYQQEPTNGVLSNVKLVTSKGDNQQSGEQAQRVGDTSARYSSDRGLLSSIYENTNKLDQPKQETQLKTTGK